jgi:protein-S-isoprenylcysteine O-methyltransferase Ste14
MIITAILFAASIVAVSILAWLYRRRLAASIRAHLPRKETVTTACLFVPIALLLVFALLPDILLLVSTMNLMPPSIRIVLALVAAGVVCVGCWKQAAPPKPHPIHWRAPETGYQAETVPVPPNNKEGP